MHLETIVTSYELSPAAPNAIFFLKDCLIIFCSGSMQLVHFGILESIIIGWSETFLVPKTMCPTMPQCVQQSGVETDFSFPTRLQPVTTHVSYYMMAVTMK